MPKGAFWAFGWFVLSLKTKQTKKPQQQKKTQPKNPTKTTLAMK